ncbi:hydroxymethylbilane synthase [Nocardiopsis mangrovi]|uniref:Hydroxymethylbilane synthase n=1 Tax=Nocardiopsis mangrovi TaxID=1179818 RepID=A0ABV9DWL5_9ACTN
MTHQQRRTLLIGSRGSHLAKAMVREFLAPLRAAHPHITFKQRTIMTSGDKDRVSSLQALGKSLTSIFATQVEEALLRDEVDIAVHSLKDLPTTPTPRTFLAVTPAREDPRDALTGTPWEGLPAGARIATSSARRIAQLAHLRPDVTTVPIRGNVPPRLRTTREMGLHGCLLASSGLRRLGMGGEIGTDMDPDLYPPPPAQGVLGVQIREGDRHLTEAEHRSPLAGTRYALRHTCVSTWLNAQVSETLVARWAGHSVAVLKKIYAKCLVGEEEHAKKKIEEALKRGRAAPAGGPDPSARIQHR